MNATTVRAMIAPTLIAGGSAVSALGYITARSESAKVGADARAGRLFDTKPVARATAFAGAGMAAAGVGLMLATRTAASKLPIALHTAGFAGTAVGAGLALVGLAALAIDHGTSVGQG